MLLRTDDAVRRLRAVWLGPEGKRLWFDWTYVAWAMFVALAFVLVPAVTVVLWATTGSPVYAFVGGPAAALMAAHFGTREMMEITDLDRPVRYWRRIVIVEARRILWRFGPVDRVSVGVIGALGVAVLAAARFGAGWVRPLVFAVVVWAAVTAVRTRFRSAAAVAARQAARLNRQPASTAAPTVWRFTVPTVSERSAMTADRRTME